MPFYFKVASTAGAIGFVDLGKLSNSLFNFSMVLDSLFSVQGSTAVNIRP
jgi:hypothetical protein